MPMPSFGPPGSKRKDPGMPCSEKEMKALMSMFVEIMGLQMNTDKLNKPRNSGKTLFKFPEDLPAPPGGWPEMWPHDNDEDSIDSVPDLEDFDVALYKLQHPTVNDFSHKRVKQTPAAQCDVVPELVTGLDGIIPLDWDCLERMAIEDALEQEERARKNNSKAKDTKKVRKKEKAREEAHIKAQEAVAKKREKSISVWKSRLAGATQSLEQLEAVLAESPLSKDDAAEVRKEHMDSLLPQ
jgi:hypothetical protein